MVAQSDNEWKSRTLCSDGNCIGVVGADGRCKVCGLPYEGTLPEPEGDDPDVDDGAVADESPADPPQAADTDHDGDTPVTPGTGDDWEERTLCIDETCIGVVGPDGRCKECGKPHPGKQP